MQPKLTSILECLEKAPDFLSWQTWPRPYGLTFPFFSFLSCKIFFYFNNSPFTLQNNTINIQLQIGSICNKLIR